MRNQRKGFTLIELLLVIGIMVLILSILMPALTKARTNAEMMKQNWDFQAIATALNNYQTINGDFPRNVALQTWSSTSWGTAPVDYSLAPALLGAGPAITQNVNGVIQQGDGADSAGTRNNSQTLIGTLSSAGAAGQSTLTMTCGPFSPPTMSPAPAGWTGGTTNAAGYPISYCCSVTLSPQSSNQETIGVANFSPALPWTAASTTVTVTLTMPMQKSHATTDNQPILSAVYGQYIAPYLSPDNFHVIFDPASGCPLILDRWQSPIQYFPRFYGQNVNRTQDSVGPLGSNPVADVVAGPLYGISAPMSIDATYGQFAIWDKRDAYLTANTQGSVFDPNVFQWMLGDDNLDNYLTNGVGGTVSETSRFSGNFVLISAGPSCVWCQFTGVPQQLRQRTFDASQNVYNFSRYGSQH